MGEIKISIEVKALKEVVTNGSTKGKFQSKIYKMKSKINESMTFSDSPGNILNQVAVEHSILGPLGNIDFPAQSQLSKTQAEQNFSFAINMVGSLSPLNSTLQLLEQSNLIPSTNMQISVQIEEIAMDSEL